MIREATFVVFGSLLALCSGQLVDIEKSQILDAHNALRGEVHPAASDMFKLKYDEQLGVVAQAHAEACKWGPNLAAAGAYPAGLGENLAFRFGNDATGAVHPTHFVHEWFAESAFFNFTTGYCAPRETCTHYMQLVSAQSTHVGCGAADCPVFEFLGMSLHNATFFVCHYTPKGVTTPGQKPYTEGTSCSACPLSHGVCDTNLCALSALSAGSPTIVGTATDSITSTTVEMVTTAESTAVTPTPAQQIPIEATSDTQFVWHGATTATAADVTVATTEKSPSAAIVSSDRFLSTAQAIEVPTTNSAQTYPRMALPTAVPEISTTGGGVTNAAFATTDSRVTTELPTAQFTTDQIKVQTSAAATPAMATGFITDMLVQATTEPVPAYYMPTAEAATPSMVEMATGATTTGAATPSMMETATGATTTGAATPSMMETATGATTTGAATPSMMETATGATTTGAATPSMMETATGATTTGAATPSMMETATGATTTGAATPSMMETATGATTTGAATPAMVETATAGTTDTVTQGLQGPSTGPTLLPVVDAFQATLPPIKIASILPAKCITPMTPLDRQECWGTAWVIWSRKYSQWQSGKCVGQIGRPVM